jgi:hypothetical protein
VKDIIIGCFNSYRPTQLQPWVNSIARSGFTGHCLAIIYGTTPAEVESMQYLQSEGFEVLSIPHFSKSIVVDRFKDAALYLHANRGKYRYVIATDVGDVVFQTNPSEFLETRLQDKDLLVGSECILYKDETWGRQNIRMSYPSHADMMMDKVIYNAGSLAGKADVVTDLFVDIYNMSIETPVYNPDQAAMNVLVQTKYKDRTYFSSMKDGWSIQCGTVADPNRLSEYGNLLLETKFEFVDVVGYNENDLKVCLIHQYNRVPTLNEKIKSKYGK